MTATGLIEYLRSQPDDFVIDWYSDGMNSDHPWEMQWVDVLFEDHMAWTFVSGLLEDDSPNDIVWPPDLVVHCLTDPNASPPFVGAIPTDLGEPVMNESLTEIRQALTGVSGEAYWTGAPGWSAAEINRAIESWCMEHVGRPMQARWDAEHGPSPFHQQAVQTLEAMQAGIEPKYMVHAGESEGGTGYTVYASEQVMEVLMQGFFDEDDDG